MPDPVILELAVNGATPAAANMFARSAELGAAPSISIFEPGFLRATLTWQRCGRLPPGAMVKLYFGGELEFGLPRTAAGLDAYLELLEPSGRARQPRPPGTPAHGRAVTERPDPRGPADQRRAPASGGRAPGRCRGGAGPAPAL
jgi:hypothetical protein